MADARTDFFQLRNDRVHNGEGIKDIDTINSLIHSKTIDDILKVWKIALFGNENEKNVYLLMNEEIVKYLKR